MLSFLYGLFIVITHMLYGDPVQGFTTLITVVLFFAGINLVSLGVVGEYVGRIFDEVKNRPVYLVRRQQGKGLEADRPTEKLSLVVNDGHDAKPSRASSRSAAL
jgi:hypothetical protein